MATESRRSAGTAATRRLFLVDDSELFLELLMDVLEGEPDLTVAGSATSGEEALETLPGMACDLALIDVSMPGMNGIELVRRLQQERPDVPCVMLSAHAGEAYVSQAMAAGARAYVEKGRPEELLATIHAVLGAGPST